MATTPPIDYDALAKQNGAIASQPAGVDYDVLAQKAGAISSVPAPASASEPEQSGPTATFLKSVWDKINPISGIEGLAQATSHPIEAFKNDVAARKAVYDKAEQAFAKGDYTGGAAHLLYSAIPLLGPQMSEAGSDLQDGQVAKGLGESVGLGLNLAASGAVKGVAPAVGAILPGEGTANWLYRSALKPNVTIAPLKSEGLVQAGLDNSIPVSKGGLTKLGGLIDDLNGKVKDVIATNPTAPINKYAVAGRLNDVLNDFSQQVNPVKAMNDIGKSGQEFLATQPASINAADAQALKVGTYKQLAGQYGKASDATISSQKALASGLKEELEMQFPEIKNLNATEGKLLDLQPVLERAVARAGNHNAVSIAAPIAGDAAKEISGSAGAGGVIGTMVGILNNPYMKSQLANAIYWGSKKSGAALSQAAALAKVQGYVNALGTAAESSNQAQPQQP